MGLSSSLGSLLLFLWTAGISDGLVKAELILNENCTNYEIQFERTFSVPGDVAMLNSTLLSPDVFNFTAVPFNITWFSTKTGQELKNETGRLLVLRETLWFLNTTMDDDGEYVTILRTASQCYMQSTRLVVDLPVPGECGRPQKAYTELTKGVADTLNCPLREFIDKLHSYGISSSIHWYKGCDLILDEPDSHTFRDINRLTIHRVETEDSGIYTCTLTFTLGGVTGSVSETIDATVSDKHFLVPQVHEPENEIIKAAKGSNFTKRCLVFVPGVGMPFVDVIWFVRNTFIFNTLKSERIYTEKRSWTQEQPKGVWLEQLLHFSELKDEDFYLNYTCRAYSSRGYPEGYFTLLPTDPNIILPTGLVFGGVTVLFIISVTVYYIFRIDIVLWLRKAFPVLYKNKDLDGKLYDAYVSCPNPGAFGFNEEVEKFVLQTLPEVLEQAFGYKLFIAGRDCLPGQAIVDSVDENLQASRRVLLLYTASTFISKRPTSSTSSNNNNISKISEEEDKTESSISETGSVGYEGGEKVFSDTRQHLEYMTAMNRALLEGSLKVILVELEEITPAQLALFPESVRHLRKKQGAVCWWMRTSQRQRTCFRGTDNVKKGGKDFQLSPSFSPSSRFWKEIRYHMPVRGKRVVYPEKTALLNL